MSGHSKWHNIQKTKGAQDAKRAAAFTKISKEMIVAVKEGGGIADPAYNSRLATVITKAKAANMPNDNIKRVLEKAAASGSGDNYETITYEGHGPCGVAVIVETMTDNRNRTAGNVRTVFGKRGGALGESGSVAFNFERIGYIKYPAAVADADTMFENALEAGANEVASDEEFHEIETIPDDLGTVTEALEAKFGTPSASRLDWKAVVKTDIDDVETAQKLMDFIEALEDDDDVQQVYHNAEFSEAVMKALEA